MVLLLALWGCEHRSVVPEGADASAPDTVVVVVPDDGTTPSEPGCVSATIRAPGGRVDAGDAILDVVPGTFGSTVVVEVCRVDAPDATPLSPGWDVRIAPPTEPALPMWMALRGGSATSAVFVPATGGDRVRSLQAAYDGGGWWEAPIHRAGIVSVAADDRVLVLFHGAETAADVLLVVDNSCSMLDEQEKLGIRLPEHLLDVLEATRVDYRLAVVPTDRTDDPNQGVTWVEATTPGRDDVLADLVSVGNAGSQHDQEGLATVEATLADDADGLGNGFLRDGASLAVIVVAHRDDASALAPSDLASQILDLGADRPSVAFHSLVDTDGDDRGTRYIEVSAEVGGLVADLVLADWNRYFEQIAFALAAPGAMVVPTAERPELWLVGDDGAEPLRVRDEHVMWDDAGLLYGVDADAKDATVWVLYQP